MEKDVNYLGIGNNQIACKVFGKTFTFTRKELNEIISLYDAVAEDFQGRNLGWRDEDGRIRLI